MVLESVLCTTCESDDVVKHGQSGERKQRYKCRNSDSRAHLNRKLQFCLKPLLCRNLEPGTIRVKKGYVLKTFTVQMSQAKQLMSFFYDTKTTAHDGWPTFGLNDTQKAAFS